MQFAAAWGGACSEMKVNFSFNAVLSGLERLTAEVADLSRKIDCSDKQMLEFALVMEELCANIIRHGARDGETRIEVGFETTEGALTAVIRDDGPPFDPTSAPQVDIEAPLEERIPGGLGIHLVQHFADAVEYRREENHNIVILRKK